MTSFSIHGSDASNRRLKKRRAAEWRMKAYGLMAITIAGLALATLLWSVLGKASGALSESYITLPIEITAKKIDPNGTKDPAVIRRANFTKLTKAMLRETFPSAKGRKQKKKLYDLLSSGAAFELADKITADPSLIGQTIEFDFLASDVADLYLQGSYGSLLLQNTAGDMTLVEGDGILTLTSSAKDFNGVFLSAKTALQTQVLQLQAQADLQNNGVEVFTRRAQDPALAVDKAKNLKLAGERRIKRDALSVEADLLRARATHMGVAEDLGRANISALVKIGGGWVKLTRIGAGSATGVALSPVKLGSYSAQDWQLLLSEKPENARGFSDQQIVWIEVLKAEGRVKSVFNTRFFSSSDSREPELAGIWGAAAGSFWTMLVTIALAFPIGVMAAIYLEEFAPKNRITDFIEVNINNLAAVPSIVFGLLGLAVFIDFFGVPRSAPLAGGIVLAVMTLPTIIIASRASIAAVPPSIRDAALGVGASQLQTAFHHVLPLSMPGIMTGTIIGLARALGETAPLIMIGMVAFIVAVPGSITDFATVLPVQIYRWSDLPERAFEARTAAAILTLMVFLIAMNLVAVLIRKKFERRW